MAYGWGIDMKPKYKRNDLVRVIEHEDNDFDTLKLIGKVGRVLETSYTPKVELGNEIIILSEDELEFVRKVNEKDLEIKRIKMISTKDNGLTATILKRISDNVFRVRLENGVRTVVHRVEFEVIE